MSEYFKRHYRVARAGAGDSDLTSFEVVVGETDLQVSIDAESMTRLLSQVAGSKEKSREEKARNPAVDIVRKRVLSCRRQLKSHIAKDPQFAASLTPHQVAPGSPEIVKRMAQAAKTAGVGPMAAVAGAIAEAVGQELSGHCRTVIIENGGDIFIKSNRERLIGIFAGPSPLSEQLALRIHPNWTPIGVCTSAGTVGPSLSFGKADAVIAISKDTALADACATAIANRVKNERSLDQAVKMGSLIPGIMGVVAIKGDRMAAWGPAVEFAPTAARKRSN